MILAQSFFDVLKNFKLHTDIFIIHYLNKYRLMALIQNSSKS